jgi:acyl-CoA synthetase (AMP-forming)/AMP-acid ligase II
MRGYKDRPDATQAAFSGSWYRTGDLGWMDDDGYLHLAGRRDDMLVTGGFNVQPQEVDDVLCLHPDVQEAAVTGEPDPVWGQVLVAHVVVKPGAAFDADALRMHCQQRLASYKVPRRWRECGPLPRNGAGKLMRAQLGASAPGAAAAA